MDLVESIIDDKFIYNLKRNMILKTMKKYDLSECKIKQKDGCYEIYMKKNGSSKKIKKVHEFKTYNKDNNKDKKRKMLEKNQDNSNIKI